MSATKVIRRASAAELLEETCLEPCPIELTNTWQVYTIRLDSDLNLSNVVGGFSWGASSADNPDGATFFLDDIQYLFDVDVPLQPHQVYYGNCGQSKRIKKGKVLNVPYLNVRL